MIFKRALICGFAALVLNIPMASSTLAGMGSTVSQGYHPPLVQGRLWAQLPAGTTPLQIVAPAIGPARLAALGAPTNGPASRTVRVATVNISGAF
jgi:hypothetical protein